MSPMMVKALVALVAVASVAELAAGKSHTIQWTSSGDYSDWSAKNPVSVGDTVVFTYGSSHTVDELSKADYESCSFANSLSSEQSGSTAVTFDKAGTRYFACATSSHCSQGQKVTITVAADGAPGAQSPPPKENPAPPAKGNSPAPKGNAAPPMAGLSVKVVLGLGVGAAFLAAF